MAKKAKNTVTTAQAMKATVLQATAVVIGGMSGEMLARLLASFGATAATAIDVARENKRAAAVAAQEIAQYDETLCGWLLLLCGVAWSWRKNRPCIGECNAHRGCNKYARWIKVHESDVRAVSGNAELITACKPGLREILDYIATHEVNLTIAAPVDATVEEVDATEKFNTAMGKLGGVWAKHKAYLAAQQQAQQVATVETTAQ